MKSHRHLAPISLDDSAAEASSTEENLFKLRQYSAFMVLLETMKEMKTKRFCCIPAVQVTLLFSVAQVLTICLCVNMNETGSPPDPGSALLRPAKNHSET